MRKELLICRSQHLPVYTMHLLIIETLLFLTIYMVEHVFSFGSKIHDHFRAYRYAFEAL